VKKIIFLGLLILLIIFSVACEKNKLNAEQPGKTLATFDGGKITTVDLDNFKKYRQDSLSDKQALEMIIEREFLYKEAQSLGITVSLKEAQAESEKAKSAIEQYGTEQDKRMIQDEIKKLDISESKYWNDHHPKQLIKPLTCEKMRKSIQDKIYADIIRNYSNWGQPEIEKGSKGAYDKAISDLKSKYNIQYVNS
jgi:Skp family chaperone for outer membrane proteins